MSSMVGGIIMLSIGVIVLTSVFISTVKGTNTTTWTAGEVALFGTLTTVAIASLLLGILNVFGVG